MLHLAGTDEHHITFLQAGSLRIQRGFQIIHRNGVGRRQHIHTLGLRNVDQHAARNDGWILVRTRFRPPARTLRLVGANVVPDFPVKPEVTERVDMGSRVGIHRNRFAGMRKELLAAIPARRRMKHHHLVSRISKGGTATIGHADKEIHAEIINLAGIDALQDLQPGGIAHHVECADLVFRSPWTFTHLIAFRENR